ncbi:hypothetical protein HNY73_018249 [Argiope bruennichi]|uniref:Uncharacterized protein n=1 Tax=Argiope bruennichi TaxID=94029 RepID=A0A8T0EH75_ARGBR|nr:hypothetical protein HNY73_018249 [Argiope bruennichi]
MCLIKRRFIGTIALLGKKSAVPVPQGKERLGLVSTRRRILKKSHVTSTGRKDKENPKTNTPEEKENSHFTSTQRYKLFEDPTIHHQ